jgi:hypothetical protein
MAEQILGVDPTRADATAQYALGLEALDPRVNDFPGNVIKYVKAAGTIAANAAVRRDPANASEPNAVLATSATGQVIAGVSIVALASSGTNQYGWITIHGKSNVLTLAVAAADTLLATTATAGTLDDLATETNVTAVVIAAIAGVPVVSVDSTAATDGVLECFIG